MTGHNNKSLPRKRKPTGKNNPISVHQNHNNLLKKIMETTAFS